MELQQFIIMIRKKFILIICIPILTAALATVVNIFVLSPIYEASSTLYIINQKSVSADVVTYEEILTNQYLVKDFRELIKSKMITNAVIKALKISDLTPAVLSQRIVVTSKNDTRVLEIKVEDSNPVRAADLTNKICQVFIEKSADLIQTNYIRIVDEAEVQYEPIKPKLLHNITIAFLVSLVAILIVFYLLELISETIKTSEDIDTYLGLNVLGTIPLFNIK